ncbi:hypothetical protein AB0G02_27110, partial [Actinosynnema sp. NPDC023658]|uniref:hypothetical protein n=1 Tax=Actinosynnema sp. NPDC023658 TaxID=3155465 RepID=UPI0033F967CF
VPPVAGQAVGGRRVHPFSASGLTTVVVVPVKPGTTCSHLRVDRQPGDVRDIAPGVTRCDPEFTGFP